MKTPLANLIEKLELPSAISLSPWLAKLLADPDSVVIIAIEKPLCTTGPIVGTAWLSSKERLEVRKALLRINKNRTTHNQPPTNQIPNASEIS